MRFGHFWGTAKFQLGAQFARSVLRVFISDRYCLGEDAEENEASLAVFSKCPASCIGIN